MGPDIIHDFKLKKFLAHSHPDSDAIARIPIRMPADWYDPTGGLPVGPSVGDRYISEATANGWTEDYVYEWNGDEWVEEEPEIGWTIWIILELVYYVFFSGGWMTYGIDEDLLIPVGDETTPLTVGNGKHTFRMPFSMHLQYVRISLTGAGSVSGDTTVDIEHNGTTIFSTKITIDYGDKTSVSADVSPVLSITELEDNAEMVINVDGVTGGADETGLKVTFLGTRNY